MSGDNSFGNFYSTSSTPSIVVGAAAGTGATASMIGGSNQSMRFKVVAGTGAINGAVCTVTMSGGFSYPTSCVPVVTMSTNGGGSAFPSGTQVMVSTSASTFSINIQGAPLTDGNTYVFDVSNIGY